VLLSNNNIINNSKSVVSLLLPLIGFNVAGKYASSKYSNQHNFIWTHGAIEAKPYM